MFGSTGARISLYLVVAWFATGFLGLFQGHLTTDLKVGQAVLAGLLAVVAGLALATVANSTKTIVKIVLEPVLLVGVVLSGIGCYRSGGSWWGLVVGGILLAVYLGILVEERDKRKLAAGTARIDALIKTRDAAKASAEAQEILAAGDVAVA